MHRRLQSVCVRAHGPDLLRHQNEAVIVERSIDALHPTHLAMPDLHPTVIWAIQLHPIAAAVLGKVTSLVRGTQGVSDGRERTVEHDDTDTRVDGKDPPLPVES